MYIVYVSIKADSVQLNKMRDVNKVLIWIFVII